MATPSKARMVEVAPAVAPIIPRQAALEQLEEAVGHYLRRHDAPELRQAYIEAREAKP